MSTTSSFLEVGPVVRGEERFPAQRDVLDVINPATAEVIGRQTCCNEADIDHIIASADQAFHDPSWHNLAAAERGRLLMKLADLVDRDADRLAELEMLDTGKPVAQLRGEMVLCAAIVRFYAGAADKIEGRVKASAEGSLNLTMYDPYGVVAGILPWNYPLVNVVLKVAPALAAGNAIVLKSSMHTPVTAVALAKLATEAGIPPGIVSVVLGPGSRIGDAIVKHPKVKKVSFTGSTAVGQALQRLASEQLKPVNLELGGKNAIVVFADADLERAAQAVLLSAFVNAGQLCVSCSRLLVEEPVADKFEAMLAEKMAKIKVGDPHDESTHVGPMINRSQCETALAYIEGAAGEGCRVLRGGGKPKLPAPYDKGFYLEPTLLTHVKPGMKVADEEIFGPCLSSIRFRDESQAIAIANGVIYGLSGSVWSCDSGRLLRMIRGMDTGIVWANTMLRGYPQIPVPPHKMSGTGVELGLEGLMAYCKSKSAVIGYDDQEPIGWSL